MSGFDLKDYRPGDSLYLWWLANPDVPRLIGELRMARTMKGVSLVYAPAWLQSGFSLNVLLMADSGEYELSPAFDVLPSGQSLGYQQFRVGVEAADSTLDNALSECRQFGLKKDEAVAQVRRVCEAVAGWRAHFAGAGVSDADIESLAAQIDRPFLLDQRQALRV
jgi:hypothetical protein